MRRLARWSRQEASPESHLSHCSSPSQPTLQSVGRVPVDTLYRDRKEEGWERRAGRDMIGLYQGNLDEALPEAYKAVWDLCQL